MLRLLEEDFVISFLHRAQVCCLMMMMMMDSPNKEVLFSVWESNSKDKVCFRPSPLMSCAFPLHVLRYGGAAGHPGPHPLLLLLLL